MARKRYTAEEIIGQLRTIEIELGKGLGVVDACRKLGITEQTYYRWKKEYGGLPVDQAKRWCWWYRKYAPEDTKLEGLEKDARDAKKWLWADPHPMPPWEWQKKK
jgi:putative transposase